LGIDRRKTRLQEDRMGIRHIFAAALLATGVATLSSGAFAAPLNGAAARVFADAAAPVVEQVRYRRTHPRRHRMDAATRDRITNNYLSRMRVQQEPDGMILLPGISTGWGGITTITGAPRTRFSNPQRLGVPRHGSGGRLTGNVPGMHRRH
jgi:hypothetical protein